MEDQLKRVHEKLQHMLRQHTLLKKENQQLKTELSRSSHLSSQQLAHIDNLKQQVEVMKISSGSWNETDKKEFEKRLNNYIKEIDRCIALLGE